MSTPKLKVHCSYVGTTGYNHHSRDFFRKLSEKIDLKIRNFTIGKSWNWPNDEPHNGESYLNNTDKKLLKEQVLWISKTDRDNFPIYTKHKNEFEHNIDLVLNETDHHFFYDSYDKPKIAYNVWESTLQPPHFFNKLLEYDQIWVPSQWQADCTIKQGADPNKVKVVPEGVDVSTFYPEDPQTTLDYKDGRFKFVLFGRWDYRKSTKEIIETFLKEFDSSEPIDLIVSIDNPFSGDGHETTEKRLKHYGFTDKRIKIKHFPSRKDYVTYLKNGHVFVSCARSEGWNLPLIEAMACGTPSIYSACSGQMEFAEGKGLPVKILGEKPVMDADYNHFSTSVGNYYEPDFEDLAHVMRNAFENYTDHKKRAVEEAKLIHRDFNWNKVAEIGNQTLQNFMANIKNEIIISFIDGAKCEIKGPLYQNYHIKFFNHKTNELIHEDTITNNMWTSPNYKSFIKWRVEIWENNSKIHEHIFDLTHKRVYIYLDSKSIGDTAAWFPQVEEFRKIHNCEVICSTFHNKWFESQYPQIQFVSPGTYVDNLYASYGIGWYYEGDKFNEHFHPLNPQQVPLSKTASDILGIPYKEIKPKIYTKNIKSDIKEDYIVISPHSTKHCAYWNHPNGWQTVIDYLNNKNYKVVMSSAEPLGDTWHDSKLGGTLKNVIDKTEKYSLEETFSLIKNSKGLIGLSSGLAWISWALNIPTIMISGHSDPTLEPTTLTRIYTPEGFCRGCHATNKLDAGDWEWCPYHKNTPRHFECTKSITPDLVIQEIDRIL